jgi:hypothetical protein
VRKSFPEHSGSLADEYDAAQERGEVAAQGKPSSAEGLPTTADIGLTHKDIHEARLVRAVTKSPPVMPAGFLLALMWRAGDSRRLSSFCASRGNKTSRTEAKRPLLIQRGAPPENFSYFFFGKNPAMWIHDVRKRGGVRWLAKSRLQ